MILCTMPARCKDRPAPTHSCIPPFDVLDADTGEMVRKVFYVDDESGLVGRFRYEDGMYIRTPDNLDVEVVWESRRVRLSFPARRPLPVVETTEGR